MPAEGFATEYQTTVSSLIGATDTTFNLTSTAGLPASPTQFRLRLEPAGGSLTQYELVVCQVASGTTVTTVGTRAAAQEGTSGQSWAVGSLASQVITAGGLVKLPQMFGIGGSALGGTPPLLTAGRFLVQAGSTVATTVGTIMTVPFPVPFPNGVLIIIPSPGDPTSLFSIAGLQAGATVSQFTVNCMTNTGSGISNTALRVNWLAVGW